MATLIIPCKIDNFSKIDLYSMNIHTEGLYKSLFKNKGEKILIENSGGRASLVCIRDSVATFEGCCNPGDLTELKSMIDFDGLEVNVDFYTGTSKSVLVSIGETTIKFTSPKGTGCEVSKALFEKVLNKI